MKNSKETLERIKHHRERVAELRSEINLLEGEMAVHNRAIKDLDETRTARIRKARFRKGVDDMVRKQDLVVAALRSIGKPVGAKAICDEMKKLGVDCHNSKFAATFLPHVQRDGRVAIERVNATKNMYSLKEWNK